MALNVISNTLKSIRALIGSQCKSRKSGVMWQDLGTFQTSLAEWGLAGCKSSGSKPAALCW